MSLDRRDFLTTALAFGLAGGAGAATAADEPATLSAQEMTAAFAAGRLSPVEATHSVLGRIERLNPKVRAFFFVDQDGALTAARAAEARWSAGAPLGPLDGVPVSVKDFIDVAGMPSPNCLPTPDANRPVAADAGYVARLRAGGAVLIGKTAQPQNMIMGSGGAVCPVYGGARNPRALDRSAGGSSSGAGAAAAAALGPLHLGADGGGSLRIPASYCGVIGFKHSRGLVSLPGMPDNNCVGPVTRRLEDAAAMMRVLAPDRFDAQAALRPADLKTLRIGLCRWVGDRALRPTPAVAAAVDAAVDRLRAQGVKVTEVPPFIPDGFWLALTRGFLGGSGQYYRRTFAENGVLEALGPISRAGLEASGRVPPEQFKAEWTSFPAILARMPDPFAEVDLMLMATMPTTAHAADRDWPEAVTPDPLLGIGTDHLEQTAVFNFTGHPAVTINCGFDADGLPIGLQIAARPGQDALLIAAALSVQKRLPPGPALPGL